jgi:hypothetical protein
VKMAFTIQQVLALLSDPTPPDTAEALAVDVTLTVVQEDGRVGYSQGTAIAVSTDVPTPLFLETEDYLDFVFNDRDRFRGPADQVSLRLSPSGASGCRLGVGLQTYGTGYSVDLDLAPSSPTTGTLYQGFGDTIGFGTGRALHLLALNNPRSAGVVDF